MMTITDLTSFEAAIESTTDEALRRMLASRLRLYRAGCLLDLTMLLVLEPGDSAADVERTAGVNPLVSPMTGARYPSLEPYWDYLELSRGWFEWICCAGDTGFATILLVPDRQDVDAELLAMFRDYAGDTSRG